MVKVIGFNNKSWTDKKTGDIRSNIEVYLEHLDSPITSGNIVSSYKFSNCIPLEVGEVYDVVTRPEAFTNRYGETEIVPKVVGLKEI